jgi:protoheme IX farnesyltransferase
VGWAAVANNVALLPLLMVGIVFYWTPPHFWALALMRQKEYRAAGVPMLPVIVGETETHKQMVIYSVLLLLICLLPALFLLLGPLYLVMALILNGVFLWQAVAIRRNPTNANVWRLYRYSLLYLALLFVAMGIDGLFYTAPANAVNLIWTLPW